MLALGKRASPEEEESRSVVVDGAAVLLHQSDALNNVCQIELLGSGELGY